MHKKAKEYFETLKWMGEINRAITAKDLLEANILEVKTARRAKDVLDGLVEYFKYDNWTLYMDSYYFCFNNLGKTRPL